MKKKILVAICILFFGVSAFAESLKGLVLTPPSYRSSNFSYEGIEHKASFITTMAGIFYTFYPSYASFWGLSINSDIGADFAVYKSISDDGRNSMYHYINSDNTESSRFIFDTELALNFRKPVKNLDKSFTYLRLGGLFHGAAFDAQQERNKDSYKEYYDGNPSEREISIFQRTFGAFAELGKNYGAGEVALKFTYDFLTASEMTDDKFIKPNSFGIMFTWKPLAFRKEFSRDAAYLQTLVDNEDVHNGNFKVYETKEEKINGSSVSVEYARRANNWWASSEWIGEPFAHKISFATTQLGSGKPGSDEYVQTTSEKVTMPFYTEEEKATAYKALEEEAERLQELERRKAENERIAQEKEIIEQKNNDSLYKKAVASKNLKELTNYIKQNRESKYFHEEAYLEIAKLLGGNNTALKELPDITNPYNLDRSGLYYAYRISVYQWIGGGSFLAETSDGNFIFIRNVYDISKIDSLIQNAYLRYKDTFEYNSTGLGKQVVAEFDLLYSFDFPYYGEQ